MKGKIVDKLMRVIWSLVGGLAGYGVYSLIKKLAPTVFPKTGIMAILPWAGIALLFAIIFFIIYPPLKRNLFKLVKSIERELKGTPLADLLIGSLGLIVGLFIAFLASRPFVDLGIPFLGTIISVVLYGVLGYLGVRLSVGRGPDLMMTFKEVRENRLTPSAPCKEKVIMQMVPKILDTSVIIDGRIADICKAGFLDGPLIVPTFVLEELQHIADSADSTKRNRGRRGLDILSSMQQNPAYEVVVTTENFPEVSEVDSKLLKLTQKLKGYIVTIDYNLNKVAKVQGLKVLNINELANAVKPVAIPGENMVINVLKEGKEPDQGLAYLDDGTMIVVENGRELIGEEIEAVVTSVIQTAAGKMIFARPAEDNQ